MCIADFAVARCPSVRPSVTRQYYVEMAQYVIKLLSPLRNHTILVFFCTKRYNNIPTATVYRELRMHAYEEIAIFDKYLALSRK